MLDMAAEQLAAEATAAEGKQLERASGPYVPPTPDENTSRDLREAHEYYLTPRAQHPRASNKMLMRSMPLVLEFDAFAFADVLLTQPMLLIAGGEAGSLWHTHRLAGMMGARAKVVIVPGAAHMDSYDRDQFVGKALREIVPFMKEKLA